LWGRDEEGFGSLLMNGMRFVVDVPEVWLKLELKKGGIICCLRAGRLAREELGNLRNRYGSQEDSVIEVSSKTLSEIRAKIRRNSKRNFEQNFVGTPSETSSKTSSELPVKLRAKLRRNFKRNFRSNFTQNPSKLHQLFQTTTSTQFTIHHRPIAVKAHKSRQTLNPLKSDMNSTINFAYLISFSDLCNHSKPSQTQ
jgi:hypothetical protein